MSRILVALLATALFGSYALANLLIIPPPSSGPVTPDILWTDEGAFQRTAARLVWTNQGSLTTP